MQLTVPLLHDGVVALRPPDPADVDAVYEACQDPAIGRFTMIPWPYERQHAVEWITGAPERWRSGTTAPFVIVDAGSGGLLGSIGLVEVASDRSSAEVGYWVRCEARGRGIAPRAVRLIVQWVLQDLGFARLELQADVSNLASHRVAEKAGFRRERDAPAPERCAGRLERVVVFALTRDDLR
jgi:RimJ/RimL family protein N-acetyltransferase